MRRSSCQHSAAHPASTLNPSTGNRYLSHAEHSEEGMFAPSRLPATKYIACTASHAATHAPAASHLRDHSILHCSSPLPDLTTPDLTTRIRHLQMRVHTHVLNDTYTQLRKKEVTRDPRTTRRRPPQCPSHVCAPPRPPASPRCAQSLPANRAGFAPAPGPATGAGHGAVHTRAGLERAGSAADADHGAVLRARELEHAGVRGALARHGRADDRAQVAVARAVAHRVAQAHLVRAKQAHLGDGAFQPQRVVSALFAVMPACK